MKFNSRKKAVLATVSAVFMASVLVASPIVQDKGVNIGEEVSAVQATKITKVTMQTTANLNVRSTASAKGKWLVTIPKGTKVSTDTKMGGWYKVSYKGKTGYVSGSYLKKVAVSKTPTKKTPAPKAKPAKPAPKATVVAEKTYQTTASLNVRSSASVKGKWLVTIPKGKQVKSNQKQNGWYKVKYGNKTGWVSGAYLKEVKPVKATSTPKKTTQAASNPAIKQNVMSRSQAEAHVSSQMAKDANGYSLMSGSGRYSVSVNFPTNGSGKAHLSVDGVSYISGVEIKPEDFGQRNYDEAKAHLAQMNRSIKVYAETQFGVGSKEANTLMAEVQKMTLQSPNGQVKKLTLQGVTITIAKHGISTNVYY